MTTPIAIIGGSGLDDFDGFKNTKTLSVTTPYGDHASGAKQGELNGQHCVFLPRHGQSHELPPHKVNYRANIHLLKQYGVKSIVAVNVVGGISADMKPEALVLPKQIIDYSYGREHTFYDGHNYQDVFTKGKSVEHIDFSYPYSAHLRKKIEHFLELKSIPFVNYGVYGCTQGPRLETQAEIKRMQQDGCDVVGMTAMPEAALARELDMDYVSLCLVVNWAAGITEQVLEIKEIMQVCDRGMGTIKTLLPELIASLLN